MSSETIEAYTLIGDLHQTPIFVLHLTQDREVHQQEVLFENVFLIAAVVLAVGFGLLIYFLLKREVVKPLTMMAAYVEQLSFNSNSSDSPDLAKSADELTVLNKAVTSTLKRKLEGMNEVSRMVAHDLRNPLTGIRGAAYVLKKNYTTVLDEKGREMLETIDDCVQYSDKIVNDLMEYSSEITLDKINLSSYDAVTAALSKFIIPNDIKVLNNTSEAHIMLVDPEKIERVITNLVANAFDAMPNGGTLTITSKKHQQSNRTGL